MSQPSLLSNLYARPELFRKDQPVYLRKPEEETDEDSREALANLRKRIGSGPFQVLRITDTPSSEAAPQLVTLEGVGGKPIVDDVGESLLLSGYYLSSDPQ